MIFPTLDGELGRTVTAHWILEDEMSAVTVSCVCDGDGMLSDGIGLGNLEWNVAVGIWNAAGMLLRPERRWAWLREQSSGPSAARDGRNDVKPSP